MKVKLEFVVEKVERMDNNEVEIIALGTTAGETLMQSQNPESAMMLQMMPPELREMLTHQLRMVRDSEKPFIRFVITESEYNEGSWKVGDTISVDITEVLTK